MKNVKIHYLLSLYLATIHFCLSNTNTIQSEQTITPTIVSPDHSAAPPTPHSCTVAVFKVIEKRTNRIKVISAILGDSARYGTLIIQPRTCEMHKYGGGHHNTIAYVDVWTLPYRAMQEVTLSYAFSPTLTFSGYMSTISPTFTHRNYEVIAMECRTETCSVNNTKADPTLFNDHHHKVN